MNPDLYHNVDYDLLRQALQDLHNLEYASEDAPSEDIFDAQKRVIERKIQEATGMRLSRLLKEDTVLPLFRRDYKQSAFLYHRY